MLIIPHMDIRYTDINHVRNKQVMPIVGRDIRLEDTDVFEIGE